MDHAVSEWETQIRQSDRLQSLSELRARCYEEISPDRADLDSEAFTAEVNRVHDAIIRRAVQLSEAAMLDNGMGPPPVSYEFVLLGSGGRMEQTLWSDQDNAILYAEPDPEQAATAASWFAAFGKEVTQALIKAGYPPCEGGVVCSEPRWCKPVTVWIGETMRWMREATWESIRYLLIVADMRHLAGSETFSVQLNREIAAYIQHHPEVLKAMLRNTLRYKVLLNVFGFFIKEPYGSEAGSLDIKYGGYIPFVNGIRLLSLENGIRETSTLGRIRKLHELGVIDQEESEEWEPAFKLLLQLRMHTNASHENGQFISSPMVMPDALEKSVLQELKSALKTGMRLQRNLRKRYDASKG